MSAPASQTVERKVDLVLKRPRSSILLLESKFVIGGSGRITYDVVRRLDGQRYRPVLCTLYEPGEVGEWFIRDGYRFYSRLITHRYDPRAFGKLRSIIEREHVELVLLINQPLTCFWGFIISKCCRIPVVAAVHNKFLGEQSPKLRFNRFLMAGSSGVSVNVLTTLGRPGSSEVTLGFPSGSKERTRRSRPPSL